MGFTTILQRPILVTYRSLIKRRSHLSMFLKMHGRIQYGGFLGVENPTQAQYDAVKEVDYQLYGFEVENLFENKEHAKQAIGAVGVPEWDPRDDIPDLDELVDFDRGVEESREAFLDRHDELVTKI